MLKTCAFCNLKSDLNMDVCSICYKELPWALDRCYQCGKELINSKESIRCQKCILSPPKIDRLCTLFKYKPPISNLITKLKFKKKLVYGNLFGQLLLEQYPLWYKTCALPEAIIPAPLHNFRHRKRGFNQVKEILNPISKERKIPIVDDLCIKIKHTKPQTRSGIKHRKINLKGAFALTRKCPYSHIAIVDDVCTTGNTIYSISTIFRNSGVQNIDVWCVCRS